MEIKWFGHACFMISAGDSNVLIDPFLSDNPKAPLGPDEVAPTQILITHGHFDHIADAVQIAQRTQAPIGGTFELVAWCESQGAQSGANQGANVGGTINFGSAWAKLVPAIHTSQIEGGPCTIANGFVIGLGGKTVYHTGDTALTYDMKLVADRTPIDVALVPIGGYYTMDRQDAVTAVELIRPQVVVPMHYDTFPPIEEDPQAFKRDVEDKGLAKVEVLQPGESFAI